MQMDKSIKVLEEEILFTFLPCYDGPAYEMTFILSESLMLNAISFAQPRYLREPPIDVTIEIRRMTTTILTYHAQGTDQKYNAITPSNSVYIKCNVPHKIIVNVLHKKIVKKFDDACNFDQIMAR